MTNISLRLDDEQKEAIQGYATIKNKTVSQVILEAILEKIEDEEDLDLAIKVAKNSKTKDFVDFKTLCKNCGIDYDSL